jgi:Rrf2 family nitric oxide-sensitive transcriptional repressor
MIKVSKKVEYGLFLVKYLSESRDESISLREVALKTKLPYRYLAKIAVNLKTGGIMESREGKSGGYSLAKDWQSRSLFDLIESLGEDKLMVECLSGNCGMAKRGCRLQSIWQKMEDGWVEELKKIKLLEI